MPGKEGEWVSGSSTKVVFRERCFRKAADHSLLGASGHTSARKCERKESDLEISFASCCRDHLPVVLLGRESWRLSRRRALIPRTASLASRETGSRGESEGSRGLPACALAGQSLSPPLAFCLHSPSSDLLTRCPAPESSSSTSSPFEQPATRFPFRPLHQSFEVTNFALDSCPALALTPECKA